MNRRDRVFKLIVEHFIKTAQPVGSKTLIDEYGLNCSSATIRAEMNALETDGLLEKTHTSSGRVPSSRGYRYYIENLRERSVDEEFKYQMQAILDQKVQSVNDVIKESCEILAQMTSLASIVLGPNVTEEKLVSVQMIPLSNNSATCVFVTDQGYVENKTFVLNGNNSLTDVQKCINLLNERLKGTAISELLMKMQLIKPILTDYVVDHEVIYRSIMETFIKFTKSRLETYGREELFEQPEFRNDAQKIKSVLDLFDTPEKIREVVDDINEDENTISVHIGGEDENDEDVSIITAKVHMPNDQNGNIAVIGPKRMDYDKVVSTLEYLVEQLNEHFNKDKRKDDSEGGRKEE